MTQQTVKADTQCRTQHYQLYTQCGLCHTKVNAVLWHLVYSLRSVTSVVFGEIGVYFGAILSEVTAFKLVHCLVPLSWV